MDSIEGTLARLETSLKPSDSELIDDSLLNVLSSNYDCFVYAVLTETKQYYVIFHPEFPPNSETTLSLMNYADKQGRRSIIEGNRKRKFDIRTNKP